MLKTIQKHSQKVKMMLLAFMVSLGTLTMPFSGVHANTHSVSESFDGQWKAVAGNVGLYGNATRFRVDGQVAWCLEPRKAAKPGVNTEFDPIQIGISYKQQNIIDLITNFGYFAQPTPTNEILTANLIWRYLGNTCGYVSSSNGYPTMASQQGWFDNVMNKVNRYGLNTSFDNTSHEISVGQSITLTDTNGVLQDMQVVSSDGLQVTKNGNQLVITGTANALDNAIIVLKKPVNNEGRNFVVRSGNSQALSVGKISDPLRSGISFKVNKNYQVAYNGNGATSGSMANQTFLYNQYQKLSANAFAKVGHTFGGWNTQANGTGISYNNQQNVKNLTSPNTTVTLYAKWNNTKPTINTPVIPTPLPPNTSNIPPFVDNGNLIIQKGDTFNALQYFTASDKEDGNITNKIKITDNTVPVDKDGRTTVAGSYTVKASVTDAGGLTGTGNLNVVVNDPPQIDAEDRWFLQGQMVSKDELLNKLKAIDKEDGDIKDKVSIDYIKYHDGRVINSPTFFDTKLSSSDKEVYISEIQYSVTDKYKASTSVIAKLHISLDKQQVKEQYKQYIRFISLNHLSSLDNKSIWKTNKELYSKLKSTLNREDASKAKVTYRYNNSEIKEIKKWLKSNKPSKQANKSFITTYLRTHQVRGSINE